jgi:rhamnose utilization protein RhaD (predicted bifunctional aldolase and dehydrogenase)
MQEAATDAIEKIQETRADVDVVMRKLDSMDRTAGLKDPEKSPYKSLREAGSKLKKQLDEVERKFWQPPKTKGIPPETDVMNKINYAAGAVDSAPGAPTPSHLAHMKTAEDLLKKTQAEFVKIQEQIAAFKQQVEAAKIQLL